MFLTKRLKHTHTPIVTKTDASEISNGSSKHVPLPTSLSLANSLKLAPSSQTFSNSICVTHCVVLCFFFVLLVVHHLVFQLDTFFRCFNSSPTGITLISFAGKYVKNRRRVEIWCPLSLSREGTRNSGQTPNRNIL